MSETALMILDRQNLSANKFTDAAQALKDDALATSAIVGRVTSAQENTIAAEAQLKLATLRRTITKAHEEGKRPFLRACQQIDAQKKEYLDEITSEETRITTLIGSYHQLQEAKRQAAEAAARLEAERIENARRAEEQRIHREAVEREAIERRKQEALASKARAEAAEAQRKITDATNAKQRAAAEAAALKQREESERAAIELKRQQELAAAQTHAQLDAAQERASNAQAAVVVAQVAHCRCRWPDGEKGFGNPDR